MIAGCPIVAPIFHYQLWRREARGNRLRQIPRKLL